MKHLKKFNNFERLKESRTTDIHKDIAEDILPKLKDIKLKSGQFTIEDYEDYMKEKGADSLMIDSVMHYLVNMGFVFSDTPEDNEVPEMELKTKN